MRIQRKQSLSFRQAMITVLVVFIIGLLFSFYQIASDLQQERERLDRDAHQLLSLIKASAAHSVYNLDDHQAQRVVQGLMAYAPVYLAEIRDDMGRVMARQLRQPTRSSLTPLAELLVASDNSYHAPLLWGEQSRSVGVVTVSFDPYLVAKDFFQRARHILLFGILRNLILALLLSVIFYYILTRPLVTTAASLAAIRPLQQSAGNISLPKGHHKDEIGLLVNTGNRVIDQYRLHIRQQEEAEAELNRLRNLLTNVVDSMPSSLICVDVEGMVIQWNHQASLLTGVATQEAIGRHLVSVFPILEQVMAQVRAAIRKGASAHDRRLRSERQGEERLYDVTIYPLTTNGIDGAVIRVDDVTERVHIEEMMIHSEKMLSIGGLAAGMAHEINNPLAGILQNIQVIGNRLQKDLPANRQAAEACGASIESIIRYLSERKVFDMMEQIRASGRRAAKIVDNMLSFSRKSDHRYQPMDIQQLVEQSLELAVSDYSLEGPFSFREIEIVREYATPLPRVLCEGSQIQQVLLNLLKNGAQAMAGLPGPARPPRFIIRLASRDGNVRIEIEDNGPGIAPEVARRIFEPFYTTKPVGVGTGLGLSVSYFIVRENYAGELYVEEAPDGGARFVLSLPCKRETEPREAGPIPLE